MNFGEWLKDKLKPDSLRKLNLSKKTVINLIALLCIGITFILIADFYSDLNKDINPAPINQSNPAETGVSDTDNTTIEYVNKMEKQLETILGKIQHAGEVSVMITLESSVEIVPAKDESVSDKVTNEKDTEGGTRVINESSTSDKVVFKNIQGSNSEPLIVKEINPDIKGVIVVAEGARDPKIKLKLTQAVQTVLDIPAYRVTVYEGTK
ncbi:MAG: stage III sporulation protein AG [Bacillota bacterium]